ncbi:hypothetical protein [Tunturiibacter gelidoferens]|jgi:hypothetical protein|uniref:Uncharacterized protein n=1 Tax=Tunturiibacter gelidiferens TaxID=3069689 RepID=A0A9X0QIJ8_9BACT|nr:hypothetical protein [Edaphobacter lichenicola]MBB5330794.1 hypothetical protein [Edaphobacter lichenicola]
MSLKVECCWLVLFVLCGSAPGQQANQPSQIDSSLTSKIDAVIKIVDALHPGMTRADVLKNFETEGGISARAWNHYVYKRCPYIKIDVTFVVAPTADQAEESATDTIATVSKPYLQFSIRD